MTLNVLQICQIKYSNDVKKKNITFRKPASDILIDRWEVDGIPRPTEQELLAQSDQYEDQYNLMKFSELGRALIQNHIDSIAQSQQYKNGVYCVSYAQSTNPIWAAEAQAFIAWRDSIFAYSLQVFSGIQEGEPAPTQEEFVAGFPEMVWPS